MLEALDWAVLWTGEGGGGGTVRQLQLCLMTVGRAVEKVTEGLQSLQQVSPLELPTSLQARAASPGSAGRVGNSAHTKQAVLHGSSGWLGCYPTSIQPFSLPGHHAEMIIAAAGMKETGLGVCLQLLLFTIRCLKTVLPFLVLMRHWSVK